ncbi:MAG: hypothetical protein EAY75_10265 [Bacteroidetes bacterium]|nr:MAG: hypothetical protein EAY75_10265 [Bacteroidota bacterium]
MHHIHIVAGAGQLKVVVQSAVKKTAYIIFMPLAKLVQRPGKANQKYWRKYTMSKTMTISQKMN